MVNQKLLNPVVGSAGHPGAHYLYVLQDSATLMRTKLAQGADLSMHSMKLLKLWMVWAARDARAAGVRAADWK